LRHEFATPEPPRLRVAIPSGEVEIETDDDEKTVVEVDDGVELRVEQRGREIIVQQEKRFGRRGDAYVRIRCPHGSDAEVEVASAEVRAGGRLGDVRVRSASADVELGSVAGRLEVTTVSGDIEVGCAGGGASIRTASGDVVIEDAADRLSIMTASGDQKIEAIGEGSLDLKSASGDIEVGIKRGSRFRVDARSLSGDTTSELEISGVETSTEGPLVDVKAASMSGDIRIVRA
jgi:DUF4097 and DUF4098 domain-containing protein YvlB